MLDPYLLPLIKPPLAVLAHPLRNLGVQADQVTLLGFIIGLLALPALAAQYYYVALVAILLNRFCDGLDGALARQTEPSDAGGFLDIVLDFVFYSAIVLGFALADPQHNALAAATLIFSFIGTGSSFLAFAVMAQKHGLEDPVYSQKSLYYIGGLAEGTETILFYVSCCLWPQHFALLAYIFAAICLLTTATRIIAGYRLLKKIPSNKHT